MTNPLRLLVGAGLAVELLHYRRCPLWLGLALTGGALLVLEVVSRVLRARKARQPA